MGGSVLLVLILSFSRTPSLELTERNSTKLFHTFESEPEFGNGHLKFGIPPL